MSTTVEAAQEHDAELESRSELPDARVLEDRTPEWMRMSARSTLFVLSLGVLLIVVFASRPLWPTDLWDHVNYGDWMLQQGTVPGTEPLLNLTQGVRMVPTAWLSQLGLAALFQSQGFAGLQFAYGLAVVLPLGIVAWGGVRRSDSIAFGFVALVTLLALNWQQILVIRPQLIGVLFFTGLVTWLLSVRCWHRSVWLLLPALFVVWANCHGSFAMGLTALAVCAVSHGCTVAVRAGSLKAGLCSGRFIRLLLLTQLCTAAALLNPAGLQAFAEVFRVGRHPNVETMYEWAPLTLHMQQGRMAALSGLLLIIVLRWSPRRLRSDEAMLLIVMAGLTFWSSRMINWLAPVMALTLAAHGAAAWNSVRRRRRSHANVPRSGLWTVVNIGLCWVFFALTTLGVQVVHGRAVAAERAVSTQTPVNAAQFLSTEAELPEGLAFCPAEWSGFLQRFGPQNFHPMVNLHVHVIPEQIWSHYQQLAAGASDWDGLMDTYGINLVVADKTVQQRLIGRIRKNADWQPIYEDAQAVMFQRKRTVPQMFRDSQ